MTITLQSGNDFLKKLDGRVLLKHALGWCLVIAYEISFVRFSAGAIFPLKDYIVYYGLNILLFYVNAHVILTYSIKSSRPGLWIPVFMFLELLVYLVIKYVLDYFLAAHHFPFVRQLIYIEKFLVPNAYRGIYFLGFSTLYWSVLRVISFQKKVYESETLRLITQKQKAELERNLAEARNAYLQLQINPHFLFNTLTFIHNSFYKYSKEASQCVLLLVEILRYSLNEADADGKIPLLKEIEQIQNFIELNQVRFSDELYIDFHTEGDFEKHEFIPLILLTLTENIFKHGDLKNKKEQASLNISVNDQNQLTFISRNLKKHKSGARRIRSVGIKNVIKRMEYSYQQQYQLKINDAEDRYGIELTVQL